MLGGGDCLTVSLGTVTPTLLVHKVSGHFGMQPCPMPGEGWGWWEEGFSEVEVSWVH